MKAKWLFYLFEFFYNFFGNAPARVQQKRYQEQKKILSFFSAYHSLLWLEMKLKWRFFNLFFDFFNYFLGIFFRDAPYRVGKNGNQNENFFSLFFGLSRLGFTRNEAWMTFFIFLDFVGKTAFRVGHKRYIKWFFFLFFGLSCPSWLEMDP